MMSETLLGGFPGPGGGRLSPPPAPILLAGSAEVLREVQELLSSHRSLATMAFHATLDHTFPGTLEEMLDRGDGR